MAIDGGKMTSTDAITDATSGTIMRGRVDLKLEAVTLPVSDVDRAKRFYENLGWRLDADLGGGEDFRIVQFTPPHSQCSIHFGSGLTSAVPGSADRLLLAVADIDAAREELIGCGVEVTDVEDTRSEGGEGPLEGRSYSMYASFNDPDGNGWLLQEVTSRLPGREWED
jgi:catechol 2,3-dioxygenase-like lactoylglutathione lyase family enzyme